MMMKLLEALEKRMKNGTLQTFKGHSDLGRNETPKGNSKREYIRAKARYKRAERQRIKGSSHRMGD